MDEKEQNDIDEAMLALTVGYAVLDEAEINPEFATRLRGILDEQVLEPGERERLGLAPLPPVDLAKLNAEIAALEEEERSLQQQIDEITRAEAAAQKG